MTHNRTSGVSRRALLVSATAAVGGSVIPWPVASQPRVLVEYHVIGSTEIAIKSYDYGAGKVYFAPHHSEQTCVKAALVVVKQRGGMLVQVVNHDRRDVTFSYQGVSYTVDPNRIFTDAGIRRTLARRNGGTYPPEVRRMVEDLAVRLSASIGSLRGRTLVALHNSTPGAYSVLSYARGGELEREAGDISINQSLDPDDFFLVTGHKLFNQLKALGYNVVLQARAGATDDGSLSVYCVKHGYAYVNVEAQKGHLREQTNMLELIAGID